MAHIPFIQFRHSEERDPNSYQGPSSSEIRSNVRSYFQVCSGCRNKASKTAQLKQCSRCLIARYCSKECQAADWKTHKETCADTTSPVHLKLTKRLVANDSLMFEVQLYAILALGLLENPENDRVSCLYIEVNTSMPADPFAHLQAMINGTPLGADPSFVLHIVSMEKKPLMAHSTAKMREDQERLRAALAVRGIGTWPVVLLVFSSDVPDSMTLEVPYGIDPQAMQRVRERKPVILNSALSGKVSVPLTEETIRECVRFHKSSPIFRHYLLPAN
ncbi:hypothetical protein FB451DRAFT_732577 [Mycena latifolia]|nr:hypothetical protein FB451DRAFT_732577 [Mycena latifolia]